MAEYIIKYLSYIIMCVITLFYANDIITKYFISKKNTEKMNNKIDELNKKIIELDSKYSKISLKSKYTIN